MYEEQRWKDLLKIFIMLLVDAPKKLDAIYLPGLSVGMIKFCNLFDHVVNLSNGKIPIIFNGSNGRGMGTQDRPGGAWPGKDWYIEEFQKRGVNADLLIPTRDGLHTRDEIDALVETCKELGLKNVGMVSVPYHYPRSFICLVNAIKQTKYFINGYAVPPKTEIGNWWIEMLGSQSINTTIAFNEMEADFQRVFTYQDKGFGCSFEDLIDYLESRG